MDGAIWLHRGQIEIYQSTDNIVFELRFVQVVRYELVFIVAVKFNETYFQSINLENSQFIFQHICR